MVLRHRVFLCPKEKRELLKLQGLLEICIGYDNFYTGSIQANFYPSELIKYSPYNDHADHGYRMLDRATSF